MENQEQTNSETAAQPDLSVTDLTNIRSIIDVAVRRGAFGATAASGFDRFAFRAIGASAFSPAPRPSTP